MRVFLSSTCYDLRDLRARIDGYLREHGHIPMLSDNTEFPVPLGQHRHDVCVDLAGKADLLIIVIDRRYGAPYERDTSISVTWAEMRSALANNVPVRAFVRQSIFSERMTWKKNPAQFKPAHCDNINTFHLLDEIQKAKAGIWLLTFDNAEEVVDHLNAMLQTTGISASAPKLTRQIAPLRILRHSPAKLFGRDKWLDALDAAWAKPRLHVYTLVAWGGVGKTSLVAHWVSERMAAKGWPGVERYFDWSFYSQGAGESRQTSSDMFIQAALEFFGDPEPIKGSTWERGQRLAGLVRKHRTLLVLDGIEPLQYPPNDPSGQAGRLKDQALESLLQSLASDNSGLVVVTTREHLKSLEGHATTEEHKLDKLTKEAAVELLRHFQIKGTEAEMETAWRDAGGHALTLQLLGTFIAQAFEDKDIRHYKEVKFEEADSGTQGRTAFKVMRAYEKWLRSAGPEHQQVLAVLRLTGLFDRPMPRGCLDMLRRWRIPQFFLRLFSRRLRQIATVFGPLASMSDREFNIALERLRGLELLTVSSSAIEVHPLIREYFAKKLKVKHRAAFVAAHSRLFDHLCKTTPETPSQADGLALLYSALYHGCQAHRYEDAWNDVYVPRILRGTRVCYATRELGLFGEDLAALAGFFESPWDTPIRGLSEHRQAFLFAMVGSRLRALGWLQAAVAPTEKALQMYEEQGLLESAAHKARHLAELQLARGDLPRAWAAAEKGVILADRSGSSYECYAERATLGAVLHHLGRPANQMFVEAGRILREEAKYPPLDRLYSLWGFRYCDFLLDQGNYLEVHEHGLWMQRMTEEKHTRQDPENGLGLISVGLERLVLGRVGLHWLKSNSKVDSAPVRHDLDLAVEELRHAGRADFIPLGHISRAAFHHFIGDVPAARADLSAALEVIDRSGMMVHKVDYFLELARLELTSVRLSQAEHALKEARVLVERIGYKRRIGEIDALDAELLTKRGGVRS